LTWFSTHGVSERGESVLQLPSYFTAQAAMALQAITTDDYKLFPSPRNEHRVIFEHQVFVPYPYALIDLPSMYLSGKYSLFAACRLPPERHENGAAGDLRAGGR
jgi:hypothetical protein